MKTKTTFSTIAIVALSFAAAGPAQAEFIPELSQHLTETLDATETAVNRSETTNPSSSTGHDWYYRRFWLRIRPRVSFKVPGFAKLEIVPELEMLWQRDLPDGWEVYKP